MLKLAYFLRNLLSLHVNYLKILTIKNAKFSGYCFYLNIKILEDFHICISVPLIRLFSEKKFNGLYPKEKNIPFCS